MHVSAGLILKAMPGSLAKLEASRDKAEAYRAKRESLAEPDASIGSPSRCSGGRRGAGSDWFSGVRGGGAGEGGQGARNWFNR